MSNMSGKSHKNVYQIKITLRGSKPPIWRRLLVPDSISLKKLHQFIQIAMGWTNSHLHQFTINGKYYGTPSPGGWRPVFDENRIHLNKIALSEGDKFIYEYDFGDSWEHIVLVEKILPSQSGMNYPLCIKGKRACPSEDIGGIWGYEAFLEAMRDPDHEEHDYYLEWGAEFDPEEFNIEEINSALHQVR